MEVLQNESKELKLSRNVDMQEFIMPSDLVALLDAAGDFARDFDLGASSTTSSSSSSSTTGVAFLVDRDLDFDFVGLGSTSTTSSSSSSSTTGAAFLVEREGRGDFARDVAALVGIVLEWRIAKHNYFQNEK